MQNSFSYYIDLELIVCNLVFIFILTKFITTLLQVNLFQKHLFLPQLTHNLTKIFHWITCSVDETSKLRTCCVHKLFWIKKNVYITCSELGIFMYWTADSMNNLLSHCGLVEVRISASEKDLCTCKTIKIYIFFQIAGSFMQK